MSRLSCCLKLGKLPCRLDRLYSGAISVRHFVENHDVP